MYLMKAIAVVITRILALTMIDSQMLITPLFQACINVVFIGKHRAAQLNSFGHDRFNGALLNIREHVKNDFSVALDHAKDRRPFHHPRTPPSGALAPSRPRGAAPLPLS